MKHRDTNMFENNQTYDNNSNNNDEDGLPIYATMDRGNRGA